MPSAALECRLDKSYKNGLGALRGAFVFRMELDGDKEWVGRKFHNLYKTGIRIDAANF